MSAVFPSSENRQHEHRPLAAAGPRVLRVKDAPIPVCLAVSLSFLWKLARTGRLHPHRVSSRCTLWDVAELDRVLGGTVE